MIERIVFAIIQTYMIVCKNEHVGEFGNMSWGAVMSPALVMILVGLLAQVLHKKK